MTLRPSTFSLKSGRPTSRFTKPRLPTKCGVGLHFDAPEYDPSKAKIRLDNPKYAYGLSVRQMAALGLTGDQVQKKFEVELDSLTAKAYYGGEYVDENTRIATRMAYGRPAKKAPPDLPSLVLDGRILYIGMPLVPSTTELLISELLWLNYDQPDNPVYVYINSTGSQTPDGQAVGFETEAYAVLDTLAYVRPKKYTVALAQAFGNAALILASGHKGCRYSMPHSRIKMQAPIMNQSYDVATNAAIKANELQSSTETYVEFMAEFTGRDAETVRKESQRDFYLTPEKAIEHGLIDQIIKTEDEMMLERDYDRMLAEDMAMQRRYGGVPSEGPSTGAE